jgi:hypothetical protein
MTQTVFESFYIIATNYIFLSLLFVSVELCHIKERRRIEGVWEQYAEVKF